MEYLQQFPAFVTGEDTFHDYGQKAIIEWNTWRATANEYLSEIEPLKVIGITFIFAYILRFFWKNILFPRESNFSRARKTFFRIVRKLPIIRGIVQKQLSDAVANYEKDFCSVSGKRLVFLQKIPADGLSAQEVIAKTTEYRNLEHVSWDKGFVSGTIYHGGKELTDIMKEVFEQFAWSNPLHIDVFPDIRKFEAEVVRMTCSMFHGDKNTRGFMTSGGTESIMLACKVYRDRALAMGIQYPEILIPKSAHAAFDKAAEFFQIGIRVIPMNPKTYEVDVKAMRRAISKNTCMIVGSTPQFPYGIIDPIEELSKLAVRYSVPLHVDACLGGFLVAFMDKAGYPLKPFDFRLPGVTSISCDTHKYAFAPKGSSVVLYRNQEYSGRQIFVQPNWIGGIYATPTFAGSRPGVITAMCWATLVHFGESGYVETTKQIIQTSRHVTESLRKIPGIFIFGEPEVSVIALGSKDFDIFSLSDELLRRGWHLNPLQFPSAIHICLTLVHTKPGVAQRFIDDVKESVEMLLKKPKGTIVEGAGAIYGMAQRIPDRSLVHELVENFISSTYITRNECDEETSDTKPTANGKGVH